MRVVVAILVVEWHWLVSVCLFDCDYVGVIRLAVGLCGMWDLFFQFIVVGFYFVYYVVYVFFWSGYLGQEVFR